MRPHLHATAIACVLLNASAFTGPSAMSQRRRDEQLVTRGLIPGWTGLVDPRGHCRFSVPANWKTHDADRLAFAPDGAATAAEEWARSSSWTSYRADLYRILEPTILWEDSAERLWFEYDAGWAGVHHIVAVPTSGGTCVLRIDVRERIADVLRPVIDKMAVSLVPLP